jgi:phage host-nuclease inhibitor protein Gam
MSDLSDHLEGEPVDYSAFTIENLESANRAMRKLAAAQKRIDERTELVMNEARRLSDWANVANKSDQRDVTFFGESLKAYVLKLREETHGETKSLSLPDGEITSRSIPAKAQVTDLEVFKKWCYDNGREAWIRTKETESANLEALKGDVEFSGDLVVDAASGQVIDGLSYVEADIAVSVKLAGEV